MLVDGDRAVASFVDAETGEVLVRESLVDHLADNPTWTVFPNSPPQNYASTDTRVRWCWLATTNCALALNNPASLPWDMLTTASTPPFSTFTTRGNNAVAVHNWDSNAGQSLGTETATPKTDREYTYPWTNQWFTEKCNPDINHDIMWNTFAKRGFGQAASSNGHLDFDPVPAFDSPYATEATVRFRPTGNASGAEAQLFVGRYEARANPIADTDDGTPLSDTFKLVPGTYEVVARGNGFGHVRTTLTVRAGQLRDFTVDMPLNIASITSGAEADNDPRNNSDCDEGSTQDDNVRAAELQLFR